MQSGTLNTGFSLIQIGYKNYIVYCTVCYPQRSIFTLQNELLCTSTHLFLTVCHTIKLVQPSSGLYFGCRIMHVYLSPCFVKIKCFCCIVSSICLEINTHNINATSCPIKNKISTFMKIHLRYQLYANDL